MYLVNTAPTFRVDFGSASVGTVTVDIIRGDGTLLVDDGATTDNTDGTYDYTLSVANNDQIDQLKLEWTITSTSEVLVTYEEIVGSLLFTIEQARGFKAKADATSALKPLGNVNEYTDAMIVAQREEITDLIEGWTGRSWITRYARVELSGRGGYELDLADGETRTADGYHLHRPGRLNDIGQILSVTADDTAITTTNFVVRGRKLRRTDNTYPLATIADPFNIIVEYVYGIPYTANGADRIGQLLLVDRLVPSEISDRALSVDSEYGTVRLVQPGGPMQNVSRIPEVNDWVNRHDSRMWI